MPEEKPFYVYVHRRATDGRVFYVGKGKKKRATDTYRRSKYWEGIAAKHGFTAHIVMRFEREECAFSFERALIKHYGRENLCNMTDGGDGVGGYIITDDVRLRISKAKTGHKHSDETKRKISKSHIGIRPNKETRLKMSASQTGKKLSDETKMRLSAAFKGKKMSEEVIQAMIARSKAKMIRCSNGMIFRSSGEAQKWLLSIGIENANAANIYRCAKELRGMAYGFCWRFE